MQGAYWQTNAALTYRGPSDRFFVSAFVNNAFNRTVIAESFPPPFRLFTVATLRPPRTYGARFGVKF